MRPGEGEVGSPRPARVANRVEAQQVTAPNRVALVQALEEERRNARVTALWGLGVVDLEPGRAEVTAERRGRGISVRDYVDRLLKETRDVQGA